MPEIKALDLPVRKESGWDGSTVPTHVAAQRRMPSHSLTLKPRGSTTAFPPRDKPEAELSLACRPLSRRETESPRPLGAEA